MPATLIIDDDLALLLRAAAGQNGQPVSEIATGILRRALAKPVPPPVSRPFRVRPHRGTFAPGIDVRKLNRLAGTLHLETPPERPPHQP